MEVVEVDQPIVVQFVNKIIADAIHRNASVIRFGGSVTRLTDTPSVGVDIHYYVDGDYVPVDTIRIQFYPAIVNRIRIMAGLDYWKMNKGQTGQIKVTVDEIPVSMSVSIEKLDDREVVTIGIART